MRIQTFSIVAGTKACNARCPFCVSKMTGSEEIPDTRNINYRNLDKAIAFAKMGSATTVLITGKGEPTLYPTEISDYLRRVNEEFPFIELQTNGLTMGWLAENHVAYNLHGLTHDVLRDWYRAGLNTIALSVSGIHQEQNRRVYHPHYPDLVTLIDFLHSFGYTVRLCLMTHTGGVYTAAGIAEVISFCKEHGVEQLTVRNIAAPNDSSNEKAQSFVATNALSKPFFDSLMVDSVFRHGKLLLKLGEVGEVWDVDGQNVCVATCLTPPKDEMIRQLIFYSNGRLTYDWQYKGAVLLGGAN